MTPYIIDCGLEHVAAGLLEAELIEACDTPYIVVEHTQKPNCYSAMLPSDTDEMALEAYLNDRFLRVGGTDLITLRDDL